MKWFFIQTTSTSVNEHSNTHYFKTFEIVPRKPEGKWKEISIDAENDSKAFDYAYFVNQDNEGIAIKQNYPENEVEAGTMAIGTALQISDEAAEEIYNSIVEDGRDDITENTARNGRPVIWYIDSEGHEAAVYLDTIELMDKEEIEEQLV